MNISVSAMGMNKRARCAGVHHVANVAPYRALVAWQQVGLFTGQHARAPIREPGTAGGLFGPALIAAELGPASDLRRARASEAVMGAGATGPFFVLRLAAVRLGVGLPWGRFCASLAMWCHRTGRSTSRIEYRRSFCVLFVAFVSAQQLHSRQVTSPLRRT